MAEIDLAGGGVATPMSGPIVLGSRRHVERAWRAAAEQDRWRSRRCEAPMARAFGAQLGRLLVLSVQVAWIGARWLWRKARGR